MALKKYQEILQIRPLRNLLIYGFIARVPHAAMGVILTLHVTQTLGYNFTQAGFAAMAFTVGAAISGPWRGRMLDQRGLRYTLLPSIILEAILWPIIAFAQLQVLIPLIFVAGIFNLPIFTIMRQSTAALVPENKRKLAFSLDSICVEIIWMIAPALGIILATQFSSHLALVAFGLSSSLAGIGLWVMNPPTHSSDEPAVAQMKSVKVPWREKYAWISKPLWGILVSAFITGIVLAATDVTIIAQLGEHQHVDDAWIVYLFWCASSAIGGIYYGAAQRDISPVLLVFLLAAFTAFCALGASPLTLSLLTIPTGLMCAASITAQAETTAELVEEKRRGEAMGWQGSALTIGTSIGAPIAGVFIDDFGAWSGFVAAAVIGVALSAFAWYLYSYKNKASAKFVS